MKLHINFFICALYSIYIAGTVAKVCKNKKCPGPLKYYQELACTPVYHSPSEKCPYRYNCDSIDNRSPDKCYLHGHTYNVGESPSYEDVYPCDLCHCAQEEGYSHFVCAIIDCFAPYEPNCYQQHNATQCCGGPLICDYKSEDRAICHVDGKIYKDGEYFEPISEPQKRCFCGPGFTGEYVAPYCTPKPEHECRIELYNSDRVYEKCAPVYEADQSLEIDCPMTFRCPTENDEIINNSSGNESSGDLKCQYGNLTLKIGDELNQGTGFTGECVKCTCEVPPVLTCQRLPTNQCSQTIKNPPFNN